MVQKKKRKIGLLLICLLLSYGTAFLGSLFTGSNTNTAWYQSIRPSITPPNWVFPIVWNILFFLIALALYYAWEAANKKEKVMVATLFGINFFLNFFWSVLYFGLKTPLWALADIILLWSFTLILILRLWKMDRLASYLLIPYWLWLTFATLLNFLSI